ncbi:MAG: hypothetical protein U5K56_02220 [Halioglobus sp.]|nr:hypothetical protein [Halioglobus sp.]
MNGYDLRGWNWASVDDTNALFNHYLVNEKVGPGPDHHFAVDAYWAPVFLQTGGAGSGVSPQLPHSLYGWTATEVDGSEERAYLSGLVDQKAGGQDRVHSGLNNTKDHSNIIDGAWFFRPLR